jgi:hypothetical protein
VFTNWKSPFLSRKFASILDYTFPCHGSHTS